MMQSTRPSYVYMQSTLSLCSERRKVEEIVCTFGGSGFSWSDDVQARDRLWTARKTALWAAMFVQPDKKVLTTDVCVPISKFPDAIEDTKRDILETQLFAPIVGHIGDGAVRPLMLTARNYVQTAIRSRRKLPRPNHV